MTRTMCRPKSANYPETPRSSLFEHINAAPISHHLVTLPKAEYEVEANVRAATHESNLAATLRRAAQLECSLRRDKCRKTNHVYSPPGLCTGHSKPNSHTTRQSSLANITGEGGGGRRGLTLPYKHTQTVMTAVLYSDDFQYTRTA